MWLDILVGIIMLQGQNGVDPTHIVECGTCGEGTYLWFFIRGADIQSILEHFHQAAD